MSETIAGLKKERDQLLLEVREWLCESCNFVYLGPPRKGAGCVICSQPECGGTTAPRATIEIKRLKSQVEGLQITKMSLTMGIARMGGKVEGSPPGFHNFLQRIDELVKIESLLKRVFKASFVFAESIQEDAVDAFDLDQLKAMNKALDKAVEEFGDPTIVKGGA